MKYSAIDLHSNNSFVTVTDDMDRVVAEKRLPNDLAMIVRFLVPWLSELVGVVVESTYNWYWLVDGLMSAGFKVHLANTGAVKKYDGLKHSGDAADARHLAQLLRLGILPEGTIMPPPERALRDLARKRMQLVRSRTSHILAIENIVARQRGSTLNSNAVKRLDAEGLVQLALPADVTLALQSNLAVVNTLSEQIDQLERRLQQALRERPEYALLMSVPGIGRTLASVIVLETGTIERFKAVGNYASYARCVDSQHISNGKKKAEGNTKNGNKYLCWAFVEAANFALRFSPEAKRFYDRKKVKTNNIVATKALAHKLARACYHMLRAQQPFDAKRCFA